MTETTPQAGEQDPPEQDPTEQEPPGQAPEKTGTLRQGQIRIGAVIAIAIAAGFIVWAVIGSGGESSSPTATGGVEGAGPVALSHGGLTTLAGGLGQSIYWVGARQRVSYELQQTQDGTAYVRYLPSGVEAGDQRQLLTVGTYPMSDAYSVTKSHAQSQGSVELSVGDDAVAFSSQANPTSAYIAFSGSDYQIEVYDPTPGVARGLVEEGAVAVVPARPAEAARAVTPRQLEQLQTSLGQPIYWAGPEPGMTYELTQTAEGLVYVRYLSQGVEVGYPKPLRTVGTYALSGAYDQTKALADESGAELIEFDGGGIAVFPKGFDGTQGYVAYPDADYQVEVFDPVPGAAHKLVMAGRIGPAG